MADPKLEYVKPLQKALTHQKSKSLPDIPWGLIVFVAFPTLIAAVYFLVVASPRYVSEARFVVRTANGGGAPSSFGIALQGVGLSAGQTDAFAVHEYVASVDAVRELETRFDLRRTFGGTGVDIFSRYPRLGESSSTEGLQDAMKRFVTVGYDSTTGISTLRVEAFAPHDAQNIATALLNGGESLVNRLNRRSSQNAVNEARAAQQQAQSRLSTIQSELTSFRNREQFIDPTRTATESSQMIGTLMASLAELRAQRNQIASSAPSSPALPAIDGRIAAYETEIENARSKIAGSQNSLAPKVGVYEELNLKRELAAEELTHATAGLVAAESEARRQQLYLERIVPPNLPQEAREPKRIISILTVFAACLLAYAVGWLVWAGVREHRQH